MLQGYIWYGVKKYPVTPGAEVMSKYLEFKEACRKDLSKKSGGYNLPEADVTNIYLAGNGWSIEEEN